MNRKTIFTYTTLFLLLGSLPLSYGGEDKDVFGEIMDWTLEEVRQAGTLKKTETGESHSRVFVGDNERYDDGRGEIKRDSFIEGPIFKDGSALSPEVMSEVVEEIKLKTKPEDWSAQIKAAEQAIGKQSLDGWYQELAECKTICAQIVVRLMAKHFEAISKLPHFFVTFPIGSDGIVHTYDGFLKQMGQYLAQDSTLNVLVIGRASRTGDRAYNRELSRKRADSIKFRLMEQNVDAGKIKIIYLGYEPPQITENIIKLYQLRDPLINLNHQINHLNSYDLNQSAVVALINR